MKNNIIYKSIFSLVVLLGLTSCDDRDIVTVENIESPIVMNLSENKLTLDGNFPDNPALTVAWDAAVYSVPVSISYNVEISADQSFKEFDVLGTVLGSEKNVSFTTGQMNAAAIGLGFAPKVQSKMYVRVSSYLGKDNLESTSNVTSLDITPYVLVYPNFYLVGAASYVGWTDTSAQLLSKNSNLAVIYTYMQKDEGFRFLGQQSWKPLNYSIDSPGTDTAYRYFKTVGSNVVADGNENMKFTGETGIYKITINATKGTQSLAIEKSPIFVFDIAQMFLIGQVDGGNATTEMTKVGDGAFEFTTKIKNGAEFKFYGQNTTGDLEWGNLTEGGNSGYLAPKGNNGDVKFDGGDATYKITVNVKAGTYEIVKI